ELYAEVSRAPAAAKLLALSRALGQDLDNLADELSPEGQTVHLRPAAQMVDPLVGDGWIDEVARPSRRSRSRARRKGEHVDVDESRAVHHFQRLLKVLIRFAGEAADDVSRQCRSIKRLIDQVQQMQELVTCVLAVHPPQEAIGSALQRQVKMRDDLRQVA